MFGAVDVVELFATAGNAAACIVNDPPRLSQQANYPPMFSGDETVDDLKRSIVSALNSAPEDFVTWLQRNRRDLPMQGKVMVRHLKQVLDDARLSVLVQNPVIEVIRSAASTQADVPLFKELYGDPEQVFFPAGRAARWLKTGGTLNQQVNPDGSPALDARTCLLEWIKEGGPGLAAVFNWRFNTGDPTMRRVINDIATVIEEDRGDRSAEGDPALPLAEQIRAIDYGSDLPGGLDILKALRVDFDLAFPDSGRTCGEMYPRLN